MTAGDERTADDQAEAERREQEESLYTTTHTPLLIAISLFQCT